MKNQKSSARWKILFVCVGVQGSDIIRLFACFCQN